MSLRKERTEKEKERNEFLSINSLIIGGEGLNSSKYIHPLMQENDEIPTLEELVGDIEKINSDAIAQLPEDMRNLISNLFERNFLMGKAVAYREVALQVDNMSGK